MGNRFMDKWRESVVKLHDFHCVLVGPKGDKHQTTGASGVDRKVSSLGGFPRFTSSDLKYQEDQKT